MKWVTERLIGNFLKAKKTCEILKSFFIFSVEMELKRLVNFLGGIILIDTSFWLSVSGLGISDMN